MPHMILRAAVAGAFALILCATARAQSSVTNAGREPSARTETQTARGAQMSGDLFGLEEMRRHLSEQREEIELLRAALREQGRALEELRARVERTEQQSAGAGTSAYVRDAGYSNARAKHLEADAATAEPHVAMTVAEQTQTAQTSQTSQTSQASQTGQPVKPPEAATRMNSAINFSGEVRLRYESFYGQQNAAPSADVPGAFGNPLTTRQRIRFRGRLAARGRFGEQFEWGLRISTGTPSDVTSGNQTVTDFFSHKSFALDQAFITYKPATLPGLQLQGGKFPTPWWRTEMTWDNDISPEGFNQSYTFKPENSKMSELSLLAWQLPFLERNSTIVTGADGRVDLEASRRAGRDLALYGAQVRAEFTPTETSRVRLAVTDNYFSGTQFINPAQYFGPNIMLPVTVNIPATATAPARTVTGQVAIPRELLISGAGNLGVLMGNTNALNRDGRFASGFNLVDLFAQVEINRRARWPFEVIFNYVKNTQARDVVRAGVDGSDVLLRNDEDEGLWAEFLLGRDVLRLRPEEIKRGDAFFSYTFIRIEKDAVLTPFNYSNLLQPSDVRAHRFVAAYAADPRVTLTLTAIFGQRPNGLLGPFTATPPGSLERTLTRIMLDTTFRF